MSHRWIKFVAIVPALMFVMVAACNKKDASAPKEPAKTADAVKPAEATEAAKPAATEGEATGATATVAMQAILAKADAMDGATDHVVSKCGMCALRMDGSDAHASKVGDYELHFCSSDCKESFDEDAEKAVMAFAVK